MSYPQAAWEPAMTVQEVLLKAISGEWHWFRAADLLGWSPRTLRRWRHRYETQGCAGSLDRRLFRPSGRAIPPGTVERILRLYRERSTASGAAPSVRGASMRPVGPWTLSCLWMATRAGHP